MTATDAVRRQFRQRFLFPARELLKRVEAARSAGRPLERVFDHDRPEQVLKETRAHLTDILRREGPAGIIDVVAYRATIAVLDQIVRTLRGWPQMTTAGSPRS